MKLDNAVMSMYIEKYLVNKQRHNNNTIHIYMTAPTGTSLCDTNVTRLVPIGHVWLVEILYADITDIGPVFFFV